MSVGLEVALISGGITLIGLVFNLAAGRASRRATSDIAMVALDAAHAAQLWDKQAEAYVDTMVFLQAADAARQQFLRQPSGPLSPQQMEKLAARYRQDDWSVIEARVSAYASEPVLIALAAMHRANDAVMDAYEQDGQTIGERLKVALQEADCKENAVRGAMAADLKATPSATAQRKNSASR